MSLLVKNIIGRAGGALAAWEQGWESRSIDLRISRRMFSSGRNLQADIASDQGSGQWRWRQRPQSMLWAAAGVLGGVSLLASRSYSRTVHADEGTELVGQLAAMSETARMSYLLKQKESADPKEREVASTILTGLESKHPTRFLNQWLKLQRLLGPIDRDDARRLFGNWVSYWDGMNRLIPVTNLAHIRSDSGGTIEARDIYFSVLAEGTAEAREWFFELLDTSNREEVRELGSQLRRAFESETLTECATALNRVTELIGPVGGGISFRGAFGDFYQPAYDRGGRFLPADHAGLRGHILNTIDRQSVVDGDQCILLQRSRLAGSRYSGNPWNYYSGNLVAYERSTGRMQWATPLCGSLVEESQELAHIRQLEKTPWGIAVLCNQSRDLTLVDPENGQIVGSVELPATPGAPCDRMLMDGTGKLYLEVLNRGSLSRTLYVGRVDPEVMEWKEEYQATYENGRVELYDDRPFLWELCEGLAKVKSDGSISDFQLQWKQEVVYHGGKVYTVSERDDHRGWQLEVFDLDEGEELSLVHEPEKTVRIDKQCYILGISDDETCVLGVFTEDPRRRKVLIVNPKTGEISDPWHYTDSWRGNFHVDDSGSVWSWGDGCGVFRSSKAKPCELVGRIHTAGEYSLAHLDGDTAYFINL